MRNDSTADGCQLGHLVVDWADVGLNVDHEADARGEQKVHPYVPREVRGLAEAVQAVDASFQPHRLRPPPEGCVTCGPVPTAVGASNQFGANVLGSQGDH
jgi:hypothetical protein